MGFCRGVYGCPSDCCLVSFASDNLIFNPQVKGGGGRNGGAGGRLAVSFIDYFFIGNFYSDGGLGTGENGAAGTVYTKDNSTENGQKTLRIYNREGEGVSLMLEISVNLSRNM